MILQSYLIINFDDNQRELHTVAVPSESKLLKLKCFTEGIYGFYSIYSTDKEQRHDTFTIVKTGNLIPTDAVFIDVLDTLIEEENGKQYLIAFPIFQIKEKTKLKKA